MKRLLILLSFLLLAFTVEGQSVLRTNPPHRAVVVADVGYCAEYQAVYDAYTTKPHADTADIDNDMVYSLDSAGYWTDFWDVLYVYATNNSTDAKINWINPGTFDCTDPGTTNPLFTRYEGFTGNIAGGDYLSANYNLNDNAVNISQNSLSLAVYCRTDEQSTEWSMGVYDGVAYSGMSLRATLAQRSYLSAAGAMTVTHLGATNAGFHMATRRGATETEGYWNGVSQGTDTDASSGLQDYNIFILGQNAADTPGSFTDAQLSIVGISKGATDDDVSKINTIIERRMRRIGKNVE